MNSDQVAAYITAYEDIEAVQRCLSGIEKQSLAINNVMIIDNSAKFPVKMSALKTNLAVTLKAFPENLGVAGALRIALAWAFEQKYNFLWVFDQDSVPDQDCLEILLKSYHTFHRESYPLSIIAPVAWDRYTQSVITPANFHQDQFLGYQPPSYVDCYECDAPITSGSLISLTAAQSVFSESPMATLFIDGVDLEYGMTLKTKGYHNLIIPQAKLAHCFGNPVIIQWWGKKKQIYQYSSLRHYYICRNYTYLVLRYSQGKYRLSALRRRLSYLLKTSIVICLFDPKDKIKKVKACWQGTFEGLIRRM
ncbi:glycosyltransferase [Dactylococcopsis salina]|uniref:Glycosyltransferase n=1 Tax=Dactylococcopsis salina (strain PCC 8305) TaxID=13035 RepID=K9YU29_DACS8|nr:glycosyltransferase [Dactylococcopsis salina]AFZ50431.1 putative glycosyltransferase [Dactylococcopsis salina PCC 8305]